MTNLPRSFEHHAQAQTNIPTQYERRFKSTTDLTLEYRFNESSYIRAPFPIWQITVPLCIVLIFAIGSLTAYSMVEGRYLFDLSVSREHIRIRTDVDKRETSSTEGEEKTSDSGMRETKADPSKIANVKVSE